MGSEVMFPVKPDELTPGITFEDYEKRRKLLIDSLPDDSVIVSVAAPIKYMSGSTYPNNCSNHHDFHSFSTRYIVSASLMMWNLVFSFHD